MTTSPAAGGMANHNYIYLSQRAQPSRPTGASSGQPILSGLMNKIIKKGQVGQDETQVEDRLKTAAKKALDTYLSLPVSEEDTFSFWNSYQKTPDKVQKSLCRQARHFLTPPPTSTDVERLFSTAGMATLNSY